MRSPLPLHAPRCHVPSGSERERLGVVNAYPWGLRAIEFLAQPVRPFRNRYPVTDALRGATWTRLLKCAIADDCVRAVVVMTQAPRLRRMVHE